MCSDGFRNFMELPIAAVGSNETGAGRDDSSRAWHFKLEVGIVWHCHEAPEGWSSEDGVVLRFTVDPFEIQYLLMEVGRTAENHLQAYFSKGVDCFPCNNSMEGCA